MLRLYSFITSEYFILHLVFSPGTFSSFSFSIARCDSAPANLGSFKRAALQVRQHHFVLTSWRNHWEVWTLITHHHTIRACSIVLQQ